MKQILYALVVFCAVGLLSCRKSGTDINIQQYDANQIQGYIQQNGISGMIRDTSGGDTTGIYYQVITAGTGKVIEYSDMISYLYTVKTLDGKYTSTDTIENHVTTYTPYVAPKGLQLAIKNILKRKGSKIRVIIPSRLAYGVNGTTITSYSSTSGTVVTGNIAGNQSLDYTISVMDNDIYTVNGVAINKQNLYDDISIQKYISASGLTGYTKNSSGIWYKITQVGTGTDVIGPTSTLGVQYTGVLLNGYAIDTETNDTGIAQRTFALLDSDTPAWKEILPLVTAGAKVTFLVPSNRGFGVLPTTNNNSGLVIPAFSCLRYDFQIITVSN